MAVEIPSENSISKLKIRNPLVYPVYASLLKNCHKWIQNIINAKEGKSCSFITNTNYELEMITSRKSNYSLRHIYS